jgi:hypothetical protein
MAQGARSRKERITVSLSRDAVKYLETARAREHAPSMSAYFETLVRNLQSQAELQRIEEATLAFYDKVTEGEMKEDSAWGGMAVASLSRLED